MILSADFYARPPLEVARDLIGKVLVHRAAGGTASGRIVEAEAYVGETDPACHAAHGRTPRNAPLYGPPGLAYVYLNYGVHCLLNAVTEAEGYPAAVLIRALEPLDGLPLMRRRRARAPWRAGRRRVDDRELCRGPGNLSRALGITLDDNCRSLSGGRLTIRDDCAARVDVVWSPRIGIRVAADRLWRASADGHPCVSGRRLVRDLMPPAHPSARRAPFSRP